MPKPKVLIVEDERPVADLIREILTAHLGCDPDTAGNGIEAFERLAGARYYLVISDIRMAGMTGTELYLWLREAQPAMDRRFLFVTAFAEERRFEADFAAWGVRILAKPFTAAQLVSACRPILELGAAEPAAASA
jgi:CheY-like chemotaxis protein